MPSTYHSQARYVAMKDSWSHGDDRRDRGRVDRGVPRPRRSRSPTARRLGSDREGKARDRSPVSSRPASHAADRHRDRSLDRRRRQSRSPLRDSREEVRERNKGRELLDTPRGSLKTRRSSSNQSPSGKRRKSRSPSPPRSHYKKSRRGVSRSPSRFEGSSVSSSRPDRKRRTLSPLPPRKRSPERRIRDVRTEGRPKYQRDTGISERRGRSSSPKHDRNEHPRRGSVHQHEKSSKRNQSPLKQNSRTHDRFSSGRSKETELRREKSPQARRKSPDIGRDEYFYRAQSPRAAGDLKARRGDSPSRERGGRVPTPRDDYRSDKVKSRGGEAPLSSGSGANSIEVNSPRPPTTISGANSTEAKSEKMAGRGFYGGQPSYNPNHQMQAAFPLKPQYNQGPNQVDHRQYSQSPQHHMTPNSYHSSPVQSPYSAGRGNWSGQQPPQQYSPQK